MAPRERQVFDVQDAGQSEQSVANRAPRRRRRDLHLPRRQRQVVSCLALGLSVEEVAQQLGIARTTAVNHRTLAGLTLGLTSVVELTHFALLQGWVQVGDALSAERVDAALRKIRQEAAAEPAPPKPAR
jgi:DNA-binding NarL/FixJ family response regulator